MAKVDRTKTQRNPGLYNPYLAFVVGNGNLAGPLMSWSGTEAIALIKPVCIGLGLETLIRLRHTNRTL